MKIVGKYAEIPKSVSISGESFQIIGASARGASHIANDRVCQDALIACEHYYRGKPLVLAAVSDGHGGKKYVLSDIGSHLAVKAFYEVAVEYGRWLIADEPSEDEKIREFERRFIRSYMYRWHQLIHEDFEKEKRDKDNNVSVATLYGCTLSFVFICDNEVYAGQIGDGAVYHYNKSREEIVAVLSSVDSDAIGLSTDSLSSKNAIYRYHYKKFKLSPLSKGILMISTDGLLDSLQENIDIVLKDIYTKRQIYGDAWLKKIWGTQLAKWSYEGVGDDMAAVLLFYGNEQENELKKNTHKSQDTSSNASEEEPENQNNSIEKKETEENPNTQKKLLEFFGKQKEGAENNE